MNKEREPVDDKLILFDGVCILCNAWVGFVIKYDKQRVFKFASMQSDKGQAILGNFNKSIEHLESMIYIESGIVYEKSAAFLRITRILSFPFRVLSWLKVFPSGFRDYVYDYVARNRYKWFGRHEQCLLPSEADKDRFL